MGSIALVSLDIEDGDKVVKALDEIGKTPVVALWAKLPDYENWRLVIASDKINQESLQEGYRQVNEALDKAQIPVHRQPTILLRPLRSPMIQELRRLFSSAKDTYGMRLSGQSFGDRYIEEAFVYRIR